MRTIRRPAEENGHSVADELAIRQDVRRRLTPVRYVEIPGLGVSVPVYADQN